ncbi:MAG: MFS transporter [Dyella sp.]
MTATSASRRNRLVALLVAGTYFMENLDASAIITALPAMARSFDVAAPRLSIGLSAYLLSLAVCIPLSGWLADRFRPSRIFPLAIGVFTLASLLCALSDSLWGFTAARVLQGLGGAMMVPVGRLVVLRRTEKHELVRAVAILTWPALVAPILGPYLGALITHALSWHWIFLLNLPLGAAALAASLWLVRDDQRNLRPFDLPGFVWTALASAALMLTVELASHSPARPATTLAMLGLGLISAALAIRHLRHVPHPLLDLRLLRIPTFAVVMGGGSLFRIAISSAPFLLPLMFQLAFGMSATRAGALLLAMFAGNLAMKPATTPLIRRFGFRRVLLINGLLVAAGFALCALFGGATPLWLIAAVLFFCGLTRSMQYTVLNTIGFADVPQPQMNSATTLVSMAQQFNVGIGIAFGALALKLAALVHGHVDHTLHADDFRLAFALVALLTLLALVDVLRLPRDAGAQVSGQHALTKR